MYSVPNLSFQEAKFQHTAARRRLTFEKLSGEAITFVSTHSRPKAAEVPFLSIFTAFGVSTHSRPKAAEPQGLGGH